MLQDKTDKQVIKYLDAKRQMEKVCPGNADKAADKGVGHHDHGCNHHARHIIELKD